MRFDVAVVGASIAGLSAARLLAEAGRRVIVLERAPALMGSRALIVTSAMERHVRDLPRTYVRNRITTFELRAGHAEAKLGLTSPDLVIDRHDLLRVLSEAATSKGTDLQMAARVTSVESTNAGWVIRGKRRGSQDPFRIEASTVVAADGALSTVAASLGHPRPRVGTLIQALVKTPADLPLDTSRVWFDREFGRFFVWLIPDAEGRAALGLVSESAATARHDLDRFLSRVRIKAEEYQSARVPLYQGWIPFSHRAGRHRAYVIGDAAGHVKVTTVGGVVHGFDAARAAVDQIIGGRRFRERRLRAELDLHLLVRRGLDQLRPAEIEDLVRAVGERRGRSHSASSRDTAALLLARVVAHRPRVAVLGAKALFRLGRLSDGVEKPHP